MTRSANEYSVKWVAGFFCLVPFLQGCEVGQMTHAATPTPEPGREKKEEKREKPEARNQGAGESQGTGESLPIPDPISRERERPNTPQATVAQHLPSLSRGGTQTIPSDSPNDGRPISKTLLLTGSLKAAQEATITTRNAGRIASVLAREGENIGAKQVLARLETRELDAQVRVADAAIAAAKAQIAQAEAAYNQQVVSSASGIAAAEAGLKSAKANLAQVQAGARNQEKAQATAQLTIAQANLKKAETDLARYSRLAKAGAVAEAEVETYQNTRDVAAEQVRAQEEALSLLAEGARQTEIEQAKQAVRQAEETLRQAKAATTQNALRRAEILAARAALKQRENERILAQQAATDAVIFAPFAGRVVKRNIEPGQRVAADEAVFQLASTNVYFEPFVPETDLPLLRVGQAVPVTVDAFPGKTFTGRITRIGAVGQTAGRTFPVRIEFPSNTNTDLRPGMFARAKAGY